MPKGHIETEEQSNRTAKCDVVGVRSDEISMAKKPVNEQKFLAKKELEEPMPEPKTPEPTSRAAPAAPVATSPVVTEEPQTTPATKSDVGEIVNGHMAMESLLQDLKAGQAGLLAMMLKLLPVPVETTEPAAKDLASMTMVRGQESTVVVAKAQNVPDGLLSKLKEISSTALVDYEKVEITLYPSATKADIKQPETVQAAKAIGDIGSKIDEMSNQLKTVLALSERVQAIEETRGASKGLEGAPPAITSPAPQSHPFAGVFTVPSKA